jgi:hypothetical protein
MKVVYADFNNFDQHGTLPLTCVGSRASIRALATPLIDGEQVVLSDGELMITAKVRKRANGTWIAECIGDYSEADGPTGTEALESTRHSDPPG